MAITRLERKGRKNISRAKARVKRIKRLNTLPLIKNVDVEAIKAEFDKKAAAKSTKPAAKKEEVKEPVAEAKAEVKVEKTEAPIVEAKADVKAEVAEKAEEVKPKATKEEK